MLTISTEKTFTGIISPHSYEVNTIEEHKFTKLRLEVER